MVIDVIFLIVAAWGFFIGFSRGIIKTVFTLFSVLFGIVAAIRLGPAATEFLESAFDSTHPMLWVAGLLLAFVLTMMIIRIIASGIEGVLESVNINVINKFAGGVLYAALLVFLYSVLLWFGEKSHVVREDSTADSMTYPYLKHFPGQMRNFYDIASPHIKEFWDKSTEALDRFEEMSIERTGGDPHIFDIKEEQDETASQ